MCGCSSSSCIQTDESIKCQLWRCPGLQLISELLFSCLFNSESKDDDAERAWELLPSQDQQVLQPSALTIAAVTSGHSDPFWWVYVLISPSDRPRTSERWIKYPRQHLHLDFKDSGCESMFQGRCSVFLLTGN